MSYAFSQLGQTRLYQSTPSKHILTLDLKQQMTRMNYVNMACLGIWDPVSLTKTDWADRIRYIPPDTFIHGSSFARAYLRASRDVVDAAFNVPPDVTLSIQQGERLNIRVQV